MFRRRSGAICFSQCLIRLDYRQNSVVFAVNLLQCLLIKLENGFDHSSKSFNPAHHVIGAWNVESEKVRQLEDDFFLVYVSLEHKSVAVIAADFFYLFLSHRTEIHCKIKISS